MISSLEQSLEQWNPSVENFSSSAGVMMASNSNNKQGNKHIGLSENADWEPLSISMPSLFMSSGNLNFAFDPPLPSNSIEEDHLGLLSCNNSSMLHRSCQQFPTDRFVIKTALDLDPNAARQRVSIPAATKTISNGRGDAMTRFVAFPTRRPTTAAPRRESFQLPINIALSHNASPEVLALLVHAAPEVVAVQDGSNGLTSLTLVLTKRGGRNDLEQIVDMILSANPQAAMIADKRQHLPLHIACQKGVSLDIVRQIVRMFPQALRRQNFHGETPLQIAQRNSKCSEDVLNFLYRYG